MKKIFLALTVASFLTVADGCQTNTNNKTTNNDSETLTGMLSFGQSDTLVKNKTQEVPEGVTLTQSGYGTTITGVYNGYNIYILNPIAFENNVNTKGCIQTYPSVNGNLTTRIVTSVTLELDLSEYGMSTGDTVTIEIRHGDCEFKILNLEVLRPGYIGKK
jgi:hypothetical protein